MKNKLCSQSLLAAVSENSLRLQEAAWLSYLSCPEDCGRREILALKEEIKVLMEALLDASNTLLVSPLSTASLYIRFELLQRDLALRVKALLLHLEEANTEHLRIIRDVLGPALSPLSEEEREKSKQAFEQKASQLMANIQWVRTTLHDVLETTAQLQSQANLLSVADHLLILTSDAVSSASQLFQSHQDRGHLHLDSIVWYWSAQAHYLVTRLQAVQGIGGHVLELMRQCLQNAGNRCSPRQHSSVAKLSAAQELGAVSHTTSAETHLTRSGCASRMAREAREMFLSRQQQSGPLSVSLASSPRRYEGEDSDTLRRGSSRMFQVTKDMATRMLHMTQFLRKKGPITSKEQLVTCARQIASDGQVFVRFGRIVAKNCPDKSCSSELLRAAEQTHTISSQLGIVARVKAVTAESKSSSELLVSNAQNLLQAILHVLRAAEAACIKGLQQPPPDSEEGEVAAFCIQWRKNLLRHRAEECLNSDRDELGLRKTQARAEPTLTAMVQEQPPQTRNNPKSPKPTKGHAITGSHP
ncbi:uncharacterized protein LOC118164949 [Oxyura jamaicensis]|uniref:uncharacterized protein LOC118164949 n=1 Tax=Oxyura jamaicensis TaxID=8884 RepID=UPI0015A4F3A2|nr:uncharacterized protein LOC118164949 [Oxyura jamaicensis]